MDKVLIYLDSCCYNRPYDDLSSDKVRLESEAVLTILEHNEHQTWTVLSSDIIVDELDRIVDMFKKEKVFTLLSSVTEYIEINEHIIGRARELGKRGIKPFDALHIASAEFEEVDVFLTTDKKLINSTRNADVTVKVLNPGVWLMEVLYDE